MSTLLSVLSIFALLYGGLLLYTGIFFTEAKKGLETYLSDVFSMYSFGFIYIMLCISAGILIVSVILMWMRNKAGFYLYFFGSFFLLLLLILAPPIDWLNIIVLAVTLIILLFNYSYFGVKEKKQNEIEP